MIDWNSIDDVFLDMDGTLLDLHYDNYFWMEHLPQRYAELKGVSSGHIREDLLARYQTMKGTLDWYCLDYWARDLQIDIVALKREILDKVRFRPSAHEFLLWLQASDKRVFLVSNAHRASIDLKFDYLDLHHLFDHICSAHDYQSPKEAQDFWQMFRDHIAFDSERTLFIDDNTQVLDSARDFGIKHLFSIAQPDLNQPEQGSEGYLQIKNFKELMGTSKNALFLR